MSATAEAVTAAKPRKVRGPSKKLRAIMATERERGYELGLNAQRADKWPGAIAATLIAVASFAAGVWLF